MAFKFNIEKARAAGLADAQIQQMIQAGPPQTRQLQAQTQTQPKPQGFQLTDLLPIGGSILGGILGTPAGLPGIVGASAIGGGIGKGAEQLLEKRPLDLGEIGKEAVLGGIGGGIGFGASKLLGLGGKILGGAAQKGAAATLKSSPSAFRNAAEVGMDVNKAFIKWLPKLGGDVDEIVGTATGKSGGKIGEFLKQTEQVIDNTAQIAGKNIRVSGDEVLKNLQQEFKVMSSRLGDQRKIKALEQIITQATKKYAKGITVKQARTILKEANNRFGASMADDAVGSVATSAQILEGQAIRSTLRRMFPEITDALNDEQELIILREIFKSTQAKNAVGGFNFGKLDITRPGTIADIVLNNPRVASKVAGLGGGQTQGKLSQFLTQGGGQVGARALLGDGGEQAGLQGTPDILEGGVVPQAVAKQPSKQEDLRKLFLALMLANPKQAGTLKSIFEFGFPEKKAGASDEFIGKATQNIDVLLKSKKLGYGPVEGRIYEGQLGLLGGAGAPSEAVELNQRYNLLKLNILRAYQGARISDKDFELARLYIPNISDTQSTAKIKLQALQDILLNSTPSEQGSTIPFPTDFAF